MPPENEMFLSTGVDHLDGILDGGIARGALVFILGLPGSGKTTLASQIAFTAAKSGKTALILTALLSRSANCWRTCAPSPFAIWNS